MKRKTPLTRGKKIAARNPKRRAEAFSRAYGSPERVAWIKAHPCIVCGAIPSQNAHTRTGGAGRKADACWIVPLCDAHHKELHRKGINTFEVKYRFALDIYAQIIDQHWEAHYATLQREGPSAQALTLIRDLSDAIAEDMAEGDDNAAD